MQLYLIRHAIAEDVAPDGRDESRPLSAQGRRRFSLEVQGLEHLGITFDRIYHSPWLRAAETAQLLTPLLTGESETTPFLARAPSIELLSQFRGERVAAVGHEPWMSELLSWLILGDAEHGGSFWFKKGGVAWLDGDPEPGRMVLRSFLAPRIARSL